MTGQRLEPVNGPPRALPQPTPWSGPRLPDPEPWDVGVPDPYLAGPSPPTESPPALRPQSRLPTKVELQVVMSATTLLGLDDEPGLLRGYGSVPVEVVREIVDSAKSTVLRGLFCDPVDGRLLAMDAKTRCFEGGLRQFVIWRDQRCRVTGGRIVDVDHVVEVQDDGATTAANGEGLGKNPHIIKPHYGITVSAEPPDRVDDGVDDLRQHAPTMRWTMPTGHSYEFPPPPALGEGSHPTRVAKSRGRP